MLVPDEQIKDIGRVKFGQVYRFNYLLKNEGDKEVTINKLVVSCTSCTVASTSQRKVKPGEIATIKVQFTPGTISKQRKHIDVLYDDTGLRLDFKGESYE